jgi:hypothetical protein
MSPAGGCDTPHIRSNVHVNAAVVTSRRDVQWYALTAVEAHRQQTDIDEVVACNAVQRAAADYASQTALG